MDALKFSNLRQRGRSLLPDLIFLTVLGLWGWWFFAPLEQVVNVELFDESGYLGIALRLPPTQWPPEYGPLYRLWYWLWSWVQSDPLRLYYLVYRITAILVPVVMYWALRRAEVRRAIAFWVAVLVLVSQGHTVVWPRVSVFAMLVFLFTLGWLWPKIKDAPWWAVLLFSAWVLWWTAFVRPETALPAIGLAVLSVVVGAWQRFPQRSRLHLVLGVTALVPLLLWGMPYQPDRLSLAFRQHFVVVRERMGDPIPDPWFNTQAIKRYFSHTDTLWEMFRERPELIKEHVVFNLYHLKANGNQVMALPLPDWIKPFLQGWRRHVIALRILVLLPFLITLARLCCWKSNQKPTFPRPDMPMFKMALPLLVITAAVGMGAVVIYPHLHYLYPLWIALLGLEAVIVGREDEDASLSWIWANRAEIAVVVVLALAMWKDANVTSWIRMPKDPSQQVIRVAEFVRSLHLPEDRIIYTLGAEGQWEVYFGPQFVALDKVFRKQEAVSLSDFIQERDVGLVLLNQELTAHVCHHGEASMQTCAALMAHPEDWGFRRFVIRLPQNREWYLFIRQDLLPPGDTGP